MCWCVHVSPGHAWQVSPEVASAVGSRDFLGIDHYWVSLERNSKVLCSVWDWRSVYFYHSTADPGVRSASKISTFLTAARAKQTNVNSQVNQFKLALWQDQGRLVHLSNVQYFYWANFLFYTLNIVHFTLLLPSKIWIQSFIWNVKSVQIKAS